MSLERFTVIQTSNFNGLNRYRREGWHAMDPVLTQRQELGFNSLRDWTVYDIGGIGITGPPDAELYRIIPEYLAFCADYGLYVEVTAFTGISPYWDRNNPQAMIDHWNRLDDALDGCTNLLDLEAVNEGDNAPNAGVPLDRLRRPIGKIASHGSAIQDAPPMQPHWDVAGYRSPSSEWQRKVGHNAMEWADAWGIPVWTNEYPRTDNDPNPQHWYDGAASSVLLCAGAGCFHSPEGKNATLFSGQTLVCAEAFIAGARSVPLEFQDGAYSRPEPNPPSVIRRYRRTLPDGRFYEVQVHE